MAVAVVAALALAVAGIGLLAAGGGGSEPGAAGPPAPSPSPVIRPTEANTGPRIPLADIAAAEVLASKTCHGKRVVGALRIGRDESGVFTFTDCEFGEISVEGHLATVNLDHVAAGAVVLNAWAPHPGPVFNARWSRMYLHAALLTASGDLDWGSARDMPVTCTSCLLYRPRGDAANGDHTEALATWGWGRGYTFVASAFVQQGPANGTATAAVNHHGVDSVFDGCWFDWQDGTAAYYTIYASGRGNVFKNSRISKGMAAYIYPDSQPPAAYIDNLDLHTGAPVEYP